MRRVMGYICGSWLMTLSFAHGYSVDTDIAIHLSLLYGTSSDYTAETTYDLDYAQELLDTNIGVLLTQSDDPDRALTQYIGNIQRAIRQQSLNQQTLREKRDEALLRQKSCLSQKQVSDNEFFHAIQDGVADDVLDEISQESSISGACAEQARVKARAYQLMIQKTESYINALQEKMTVLRNNETFILQNAGLINTDPTTIIQVNRLIQELD